MKFLRNITKIQYYTKNISNRLYFSSTYIIDLLNDEIQYHKTIENKPIDVKIIEDKDNEIKYDNKNEIDDLDTYETKLSELHASRH
tara:strand:+ start:71 stop:328 length:258 start_codon:yes stop_codon:yes gene_type:complete